MACFATGVCVARWRSPIRGYFLFTFWSSSQQATAPIAHSYKSSETETKFILTGYCHWRWILAELSQISEAALQDFLLHWLTSGNGMHRVVTNHVLFFYLWAHVLSSTSQRQSYLSWNWYNKGTLHYNYRSLVTLELLSLQLQLKWCWMLILWSSPNFIEELSLYCVPIIFLTWK